MFKKSLASLVSAAVIVAGPGHLSMNAAAQTMRAPVTGVSVTPSIGAGLGSPVSTSFNVPVLAPSALTAPSLTAAPSAAAPAPVAAAPVAAAQPVAVKAAAVTPAEAAKAFPQGSYAALRAIQLPPASKGEQGGVEAAQALNRAFDNSGSAASSALEVAGAASVVEFGLTRADVASAKSPAAVERAAMNAGKAASAGELAIVSLAKRAWNALLGILGIGVKKMESPEVMAQRIIDQLNAQKPVYNRKVQEASTLVERLKLQVEGETKKVAELERGITALLSDSDAANDIMASGMINQQKTLNASIAASNEQIGLAEKTLESIKEERARFFSEREEMLAKIQAGLTKSKSAEIQKQIAELKGGFQVGDLKDNMDRFEDAVNDKVADAKGTVDSVESNPDEILKKAKDSLKSQEVQDEIAKRKAAIEAAKKAKEQSGGKIGSTLQAVGVAVNVLTAVWAGLNTGWIAGLLGAGAAMGFIIPLGGIGAMALGVFAEKVMKTSGAKTAGMALLGGVIGVVLSLVGVGVAGWIGWTVASNSAAIGLGVTALVGSLLNIGWTSIFGAKKAADDKTATGGLVVELGIAAAVVGVIALVSKPFRNLLARAWNAALGALGIGVKKLETPEVMAQRIIDQLNAQKPVYNRKVQEASTLVEKLRLQIEKQSAQSAELDRSVTAILSDSDPLNDVMAESLLNQKKTVDASTAMTKEQLTISEQTLVSIKEERARFFGEREEMLAKIQAGLTKSKSAEIQKQIAELKGGFQVGDLKDNMDRFEDAVNDKVADAKGTVDSVESNPDEILKKAKDSLKNAEVQDEIAKRKAAIEAAKKAKSQTGGDASQSKALGYFAKAIGIGFALISPWISSAVFALLGLVAIAMSPEQGRWFGRQLAVIGLGTLAIGGAAAFATAKLGLAVGAFGVGISFVVPAGIALAAGVIAALRARSKANGAVAAASATPAGSSVAPAPAAPSLPEATATPAGQTSSAPKTSFSIKPLLNLISRAWNALLGLFGIGVKAMETPEIMAQRLIDQLNDAKPVYNNKVREASTLVEKLRQQIAAEEAKIAEFEKTITAILSDNNAANDIQAAGLLNSQKTLQASVAASREQLSASEQTLVNIKEERARFFSEREETLAKIQAGLTKVKSAEIQKQIAELKGGFQIGDLKDNIDRFDGAVADKVADAKGATDAVDSNPDQILKKAKDSLRSQEVADELAKRKAAIDAAKKAKEQTGGAVTVDSVSAAVMVASAIGLFFAAGPILGFAGAYIGLKGSLLLAIGLGMTPLLLGAAVELGWNLISPSPRRTTRPRPAASSPSSASRRP
ncbi:MAG: hypothetical protein M0D55_18200 [Elusimicrobiota bacterium]|nr:MAG: hypothetical protein M0D55_18200 [Elusimicrobiota bacterium]